MKQGEIWFANLNPVKGSDQSGQRPVVILSGNLLNEHLGVVIVAPLASKIKNYKGNPIISASKSSGLKAESELLVFHLRSVSKDRLTNNIGSVEASVIQQAISTLNDILKF